jgi:mono/diheme cytochrome c family protein
MSIMGSVAKATARAVLLVALVVPGGLAVSVSAQDNALPSLAEGEQLYRENCTTCHGIEGSGDGVASQGLGPIPADLVARAEALSDEALFERISEGHGPMPPWKYHMSEQQLRDVVYYLRHGIYRESASAR